MKVAISIIFFIILGISAQAQGQFVYPKNSDYPQLAKTGNQIADFIPPNWKIMEMATGDLNGDGVKDHAVVIQGDFARFHFENDGLGVSKFDTNPRILAVLLSRSTKKGYELKLQNNKFIPIRDSPTMSEPLTGIKIAKGVLKINFELWFSAGSWATSDYSYKFKLRGENLVMIGKTVSESMRNQGTVVTEDYNFLTGRRKITYSNYDESVKPTHEWSRFRVLRLRNLKTLGPPFNFDEY